MSERTITFDRFARILSYCLLALVIILLINYLSGVLLPFALAWLFAYLLYPAVKFVQFRMHVKNRALSIIITLLGVIIVISGIVWAIIPPMIDQFDKLQHLVANYFTHSPEGKGVVAEIQGWIERNQEQIMAFVQSPDFTDTLKTALPKVFSVVGDIVGVTLSVIAFGITLLYMFFILMDYEKLSSSAIKLFPQRMRPFFHELMGDMTTNLNAYVRGQGLIALIVGILFAIGFTIIDFPMAIGLGILIGILNLVPYLQTLGFIPTILLAALKSVDTGQNFWVILLSALAVFAVVQIIQDMVLTPKIMGKAMNLNPAIILLSLSVWGALLGFVGLIIALPLTTLLMTYYRRYVTKEDEVIKEIEEKKEE